MSDRDDHQDDLSWLYDDEDAAPAPAPRPSSSSGRLSDLYDDEEILGLLPPLEEMEEAEEGDSESFATRLGKLFSRNKGEELGADASEPSRAERGRTKKAEQEESSEPRRRRKGSSLVEDQDDPFARLVTPLSDAQVSALRTELGREEILLIKWQRDHQLDARWRSIGLLLALAVLALLSIRYGHTFIDRNLRNPNPPKQLVEQLGQERSEAFIFALAVMLPFLSIGLMIDVFAQTLRTFAMRSISALLLAALSGFALLTFATLILSGEPVVAALTLGAWAVVRAVVRAVVGRGGRS